MGETKPWSVAVGRFCCYTSRSSGRGRGVWESDDARTADVGENGADMKDKCLLGSLRTGLNASINVPG